MDSVLKIEVETHVAEIAPRVSSVQIILTVVDPLNGTTEIFAAGKGDLLARVGAAEHWLSTVTGT